MFTLRQKYLVSCSLAGLALAGLTPGASADPLVIENVSAMDAARQISDKYGINVVLKGDFGGPRRVSFTLTDADSPGSQLEAVNDLANALRADFTKTFVISKVPADQDVPSPNLDSTGDVHFDSVTVPAQVAISTVAGVDDAQAQIVGDISGNVTLTGTQLSATSAATEIATQTHTRWKAFYALTSKTGRRATVGTGIGHALPHVYYRHIPTPAELQAQQQADQVAQQANNSPTNGYDPYGYGGYNYGDPYGYGGGYGYGGYPGGYGSNGGYYDNGNGLIIGNGNSYGGPIVFQSGGYYGY